MEIGKIEKLNRKIKSLEAELMVATASIPSNLHNAHRRLANVNSDKMKGSGVVISIVNLAGDEMVPPFLCSDGLSLECIQALRRQINVTANIQILSLPNEMTRMDVSELTELKIIG